ncbi:nucleotidyltransferase family protein [Chelatococcus sp. GCM10030263]|uniref:nucleotidyltransferase family protein n=1 Tax=Chelatococcus sp. GCM10030263 TaxID=3273387 RepID=UPI00360D2E53
MTSASVALRALIACVKGEPPRMDAWTPVIELANRSWLTPALFSALARASRLDVLPQEVGAYCAFIHERNRERNRRLLAQLEEAVGALNGSGIRPTLLKGAAILVTAPDDRQGSRMMCDLDLMVDHHEHEAADACLRGIGYRTTYGMEGMWRPDDTGLLELHCGSGSFDRYYPAEELARSSALVARGAMSARLTSATCRVLHLVVHDQIKEGDYWRGTLDLRHLHDLYELTRAPEAIDWGYLREVLSDRLGRHALQTEILSLHTLFGTPLPHEIHFDVMARAQHRRRMLQQSHPVASMPLRLAGEMAWIRQRVRAPDGVDPFRQGFARRVLRKLLQGPKKTYASLRGVHLGPKL